MSRAFLVDLGVSNMFRYSKQGIIWGVVESKLRDLLQESAIVCVANQLLTDEQAKKYFFSGLYAQLHVQLYIYS